MAESYELVRALDRAARRLETPCGGGRMVWRVWGEGPTLVLLHGGHGSWTHWIKVIPELALRWRVAAADLPGMGESDAPPAPYSAETLGEIVARGLDAVVPHDEACDLVGFSFGGIMTGHAALLRPHRVRMMVLVGAGGLGLTRGSTDEMRSWRRVADEAQRLAIHRRNLEILMIHDPAKIDDLAVRLQDENTRRARLRSRPIAHTPTLRRALEAGSVPLAGIWGERDATVGAHMEEYRRLIHGLRAGAEFHVIEGAGHWVPYEAPARFLQTLLGVLARDPALGVSAAADVPAC